MTVEITETRFDAGDATLNCAETPPNGPPLLLLHGGSARWQSFERLMPRLAERWHVYALELRGHGRSGRTPSRYRLRDYTDDVAAFLETLPEPALLFGHSLGGGIALLAAARCPDRVRAVAVGDSPLDRETWRAHIDATRERVAAWRDLAGGQLSVPDLIRTLQEAPTEQPGKAEPVPMRAVYGAHHPVFEWLAANLYHNDPDMLTVLLQDFDAFSAGYEMGQVLPTIRCPVLLLQGDPGSGGLMTDAEVARALGLLARGSHARLRGVSHALHHTHPEAVLEALVPFFSAA